MPMESVSEKSETQSLPDRQAVGSSDASLSTGDLADLMSAFTEVTTKLEHTHGQLRSEVSRLNVELSQANEALQRSKRLAALGEMAAGISHEIRNPLGSIRLYANMLIEDLETLPEQQQIVQKIGRAVHGLDEIVGDVLTFAREIKINWHPCEASDLIEHALELCVADIDCEIVRDDLEADSIELVCDPTLIQQALVNVVRNAGEANRASGGSKITANVRRGVFIQGESEVDAVVFSICDQGDGMPPEVAERMFNPFFTTRATGTGLGLAIVHRIIDSHRGKIEVIHNADRGHGHRGSESVGTTVEFYVPKIQSLVVSRGAHASGAEIVIKAGHNAERILG